MLRRSWNVAVLLLAVGTAAGSPGYTHAGEKTRTEGTTETEQANSREFEFTYGAALKELPVGANVRVWIPVPSSSTSRQAQELSPESWRSIQVRIAMRWPSRVALMALSRRFSITESRRVGSPIMGRRERS